MAEEQRMRRDGVTPKGQPKGARGKQPNWRPDYEVQKIDDGLMEVVGTPVRIYYNPEHDWGRPVEIWFRDKHLGTYAKLNPAIDMARKKANELKARKFW